MRTSALIALTLPLAAADENAPHDVNVN